MTETKLFIHGRYVNAHSGKSFDNLNPATGESLGKVQIADEKDVNDAVQSALEGYTEWSAYSGIQRGRVLHRVQEILRARNNELAKWETLDTGKPLQESISVDIHLGADCFEYYAGVAPTLSGEHMIFPGGFSYTRREPLGVCAGIGAWNYPLQVACWKIAPALACGNAMVYKPAELTPITSAMLGEILIEAGVPKGVYNVVQGFGETGAMLSRHSDIAKVSLTGEVGTGKRVMADAAATLKRVTMELGGKSPLLVFEDADINNAVSAAMLGNFYTQGEICTNCTRVFVHHTIKNAFVKQLLHRTAKLKLGDPTNPQTQVGSLINRDHQQKVLACIEKAKLAGAKLLIGGGVPDDAQLANGAFVEPTIFDECQDDMPNVKEEIFGPVLSLLSFAEEDEVIQRANNTPYGLAAGVFTKDLVRAHRVVARLQAGICWINNYNVYPMQLPAGGFKQSGIGTENGMETVKQYTQLKTVHVEMGDVDLPYE
ncbi:MAG: betaine-aldehyde dehydrogenase [Candidatus Zeuxoniibacter abyssi]|nr:MAG: betaine-aldehyde dehydrogenase [Candidatus Persebacteraceae bacterium AB1(2)]